MSDSSRPEFKVDVHVTVTYPHGIDTRSVHRTILLDPVEMRSMKVRYHVAADLKMSRAFEAAGREAAALVAEAMMGESGKLPT
ncbi:MAG: hypothetical protein ACM3JP_02760 [Betaproteobacteria bacterium]